MNKILYIVFGLCLSLSIEAQEQRLLSDVEFFQKLNLDYQGLEKVKMYVSDGNLTQAKKEFVSYLKNRNTPKWYFSWKDFSPQNDYTIKPEILSYADRHVNNELVAHGTWYQYGKNIDWTEDHSYDHYNEWLWQLNIHYCWVNLADAYWATGDEKYSRAFVHQLNGWIDQCSNLIYNWDGVGSMWRPLDAGQRMQNNWPTLLYRFLSSPSFDDESIIKMVKSFYQHAVHLRNHPTANNWLTLEMSGLFIAGGLFPEYKESEDWRLFAVNKLDEEIQELFYPDGAEIELTPTYHLVAVSSLLTVSEFAQLNGYTLPEGFINRLEGAYEFFIKIMMPDGLMPALNDSGWKSCKEYILEAATLFPNNKIFKYFATDGKEGVRPAYTSIWMPWAGWYVMRSGWEKDALYALFEVGPFGSAHQHEDKLSFIIYAYGARLITESGYYSYDQSEWRKYSLSARGHNVARVDGKDQNRRMIANRDIKVNRQPLSNVWISNRRFDYGEGSYIEGFGQESDKTVSHIRTLKFIKNKCWIVTDTFSPSDSLYHNYDTWFHFSTPLFGIDSNLGIVYSQAINTPNIAILPLDKNTTCTVIKGQETPEIQGWIPVPGGGNGYHCEPIATPTFHVTGKGVIKEVYLFIPFQANQSMPVVKVKKINNTKYRIFFDDGKKMTVKI